MFTNQSFNDRTQANYRHQFKTCGGWGRKQGSQLPWPHKMRQFFNDRKPVNIEETDSEYILSLYAAGLQKERFSIAVNEGVLTIKYDATQAPSAKYILQEVEDASFERSFQLSDKVLTDNINAQYENGVLKITLQKNPETNIPAQEIKVG